MRRCGKEDEADNGRNTSVAGKITWPMCTACSPGGSQLIHFSAGKSGKRFVTRSTVRKKVFVVYSVCVWVDKTD